MKLGSFEPLRIRLTLNATSKRHENTLRNILDLFPFFFFSILLRVEFQRDASNHESLHSEFEIDEY